MYNYTGRTPLAPLKLVTTRGPSFYVKLVEIRTGREAYGIFIHGGGSLEVEVPLGRYELRYATGHTWYGLINLFGPERATTRFKADDIFEFREEANSYIGYTVELILQIDGNLHTREIPPEQF